MAHSIIRCATSKTQASILWRFWDISKTQALLIDRYQDAYTLTGKTQSVEVNSRASRLNTYMTVTNHRPLKCCILLPNFSIFTTKYNLIDIYSKSDILISYNCGLMKDKLFLNITIKSSAKSTDPRIFPRCLVKGSGCKLQAASDR